QASPYLVDVAGQAAAPDVDRAHVQLAEGLRELLLVPRGRVPDAQRAGERRPHVPVQGEERDLRVDLGGVAAKIARQVLDEAGPGDRRVRVEQVLLRFAQRERGAGTGDERVGAERLATRCGRQDG